MQSFKLDISSVRYVFGVQLAPGLCVFKATDYRLDPLASLLVGVVLLWGVGILEGFPPRWRDEERGVARDESPTVSDASEHTDWMSEMSKSEASLPLRLLPLLPALLPGRLEFFRDSRWIKSMTTINGEHVSQVIQVPSHFLLGESSQVPTSKYKLSLKSFSFCQVKLEVIHTLTWVDSSSGHNDMNPHLWLMNCWDWAKTVEASFFCFFWHFTLFMLWSSCKCLVDYLKNWVVLQIKI